MNLTGAKFSPKAWQSIKRNVQKRLVNYWKRCCQMTKNEGILNDCFIYTEYALDRIIASKEVKDERWNDEYESHMQRVCAQWRFV